MKLFTTIFLTLFCLNNYSVVQSNDCKELMHPVHVSFTTIEYFEETHEYKILFKIFVDDFDLILYKIYGKDLKLFEGRWEPNYKGIINKYLNDNFKIINDNRESLKLKFEQQKIEEQAIWLTFKAKHKTKTANFQILNNILCDLYPDQKNLLIFVYHDNTKALEFNVENITQEIQF